MHVNYKFLVEALESYYLSFDSKKAIVLEVVINT